MVQEIEFENMNTNNGNEMVVEEEVVAEVNTRKKQEAVRSANPNAAKPKNEPNIEPKPVEAPFIPEL
jgi:hypothetical protein